MNAQPYHYVECGLDNVWVEGVDVQQDDAGRTARTIHNITGLHKAIAEAICQGRGMSGKELRFLRTELGLTQDELARMLHKEPLTVSRWERGENPIEPNAETVLRMLAIERLGLGRMKVERLSALCISVARDGVIRIDGSNPERYKPVRQKTAA